MKRVELGSKWDDNWKDIIDEAINEELSVGEKVQSMSPYKDSDNPDEPNSAVGWLLEKEQKYLRSNRNNGIRATRVRDFFDTDANAVLLKEAVGAYMLGGIKSFVDVQLAAAGGSSDFAPGSVFRPRGRAPMVDGGNLRASVPIDAVIAAVRDLSDAQIPVYLPNEDAESNQNWRPRTPIPLDALTVGEDTIKTRWYATGIAIDTELRNSSAELLLMYADNRRVRYERVVSERAIQLAMDAAPSTNVDVGTTGASSLNIASEFVDRDFAITTLIGNQSTVQSYLGYDRGAFYFNAGGASPTGSAAGFDRFASAVDRDVYMTARPSIANNVLVGMDARQGVDLFVAPGSETSADEFIQRTRSYELTYTIKYVVALRHPTDVVTDAEDRPFRNFSLS